MNITQKMLDEINLLRDLNYEKMKKIIILQEKADLWDKYEERLEKALTIIQGLSE